MAKVITPPCSRLAVAVLVPFGVAVRGAALFAFFAKGAGFELSDSNCDSWTTGFEFSPRGDTSGQSQNHARSPRRAFGTRKGNGSRQENINCNANRQRSYRPVSYHVKLKRGVPNMRTLLKHVLSPQSNASNATHISSSGPLLILRNDEW
jgi:hypothetical protein